MVKILENIVFKFKSVILITLLGFTLYAGFIIDLKFDAGYEKRLPVGHEYIQTLNDYREKLPGVNRIIVVLETREGTIWTKDFFKKYQELTEAVKYIEARNTSGEEMRGVEQQTVTSLWTPNTRYLEVTEDGIHADDVISGNIRLENMDKKDLEKIRDNVVRGNFVGRLVGKDFKSAMVRAELLEIDPKTLKPLDYFALAGKLEEDIRGKFEDEQYKISIIGFAKLIGDIADKAGADVYDAPEDAPLLERLLDRYGVVQFFFTTAFLLTALALYLYARSVVLSLVTLACSMVSVVWQFGILHLLGFGLDPLAILVPFLIFAIGISHGVQQINLITKELGENKTSEEAARASFSGLLVPGSMALITDLVGFGTLYIIAIPMIKELAIVASIGVALKIITNLIMLPLLVSYFKFRPSFAARTAQAREFRLKIMRFLGGIANPKIAPVGLAIVAVIFVAAIFASQDRHVGALHPGSPELRPDARYNQDSREIAAKFSLGLNLLTVVTETPAESCIKYPYLNYLDRLSWHIENIKGVALVLSVPYVAKQVASAWSEANLKWRALPRNRYSLVQATSSIPESSGLHGDNCQYMTQLVFLEDAKAETIKRAVSGIKEFREKNPSPFRDVEIATEQPLFKLPTNLPDNITMAVYRDTDNKVIITYDVNVTTAEAIVSDLKSKGVLVTEHKDTGVKIRLASGNIGVQAAVNEEVESTELPMLIYVYLAIIFLVWFTYRDVRALIACCVPLSVATFLGYWFMQTLEIGLTISTLPVMVLAVGLGVDYAFYIYNRIQFHLSQGDDITISYRKTLEETGMAVVFTAVTMAIGVSTWAFSGLKFQADMGLLLTFMFLTNMIMTITALPCLAVVMDMVFPRKKAVKPPAGALSH